MKLRRQPSSPEVPIRIAGFFLLIALLVGGCLERPLPPPVPPPPKLHRAPGGGYVTGDTSYHGSGGP